MGEGIIFIIHGMSSSGKTSIVRALQEFLTEPYLEAGIDNFFSMIPERYLERPLWDEMLGQVVKAGAAGHTLVSRMQHALAALSRAGANVIADHVLVEPAWTKEYAKLFAPLPAYRVGVQGPLAVLEQRERSRKNRTLGPARTQFDVILKYTCYDLEVDSSLLNPQEGSRWIESRLGEPPQVLKRMRQMI